MGYCEAMKNKSIVDYIITWSDTHECIPSDVASLPNGNTGIAWNSRYFYFDIEVGENVEATLSPFRHEIEFIDIADPVDSYAELDIILNKILLRHKEVEKNPKS